LEENKDKELVAAERNRHLDFDRDQALDAKNYGETNLDLDRLRSFDNLDSARANALDLAKEEALRRNLDLNEGGEFWKRQFDDDFDGGDFDIDFDDSSSPSSSSPSPSTSSPTLTAPEDESTSGEFHFFTLPL
jgi:hypothetical protein